MGNTDARCKSIEHQSTPNMKYMELVVVYFIRMSCSNTYNTFPMDIISLINLFASRLCTISLLQCAGIRTSINRYKLREELNALQTLLSDTGGYATIASNCFNICIQTYDKSMHCFPTNQTSNPSIKLKNDYIRVISTDKSAYGAKSAFIITQKGQLYQAGSHTYFKAVKYNKITSFTKVNANPKMMRTIRKIQSGHSHSIFLTFNGSVAVIGDNTKGQCGMSKRNKCVKSLQFLDAFGSDVHIIDIAVSGDSTMCLSKSGTLFGFGANNRAELGLVHFDAVYEPTLCHFFVAANVRVKMVDMYNGYTAVVTHNKRLYMFGRNTNGTIGNGTSGMGNTILVRTPFWVQPYEVEYVYCGGEAVFFLTTENELYAMGTKHGLVPKLVSTCHDSVERVISTQCLYETLILIIGTKHEAQVK
eukprot:958051_1